MSVGMNKNSTGAISVLTRMNVIHLEPDPFDNFTECQEEDTKTYTPLHRKSKRSKFKRRSK